MPRPRPTYSSLGAEEPKTSIPDQVITVSPGDAELTEEELQAEVASEKAGELAFVIRAVDRESVSFYGGAGESGVSTGNSATQFGSLASLMRGAFPRNRRGRTFRAYHHYEEDDLLNSLIELKIDFTISGLSMQAKPPIGFGDQEEEQNLISEFQAVLDDLVLDMDIDKLVEDLLRDYFITDTMILYWRVETTPGTASGNNKASETSTPNSSGNIESTVGIPGIFDVCAINPGTVDWDNSLGRDILQVDIPNALYEEIYNALKLVTNRAESLQVVVKSLLNRGIDMKYIEAVRVGKRTVTLRREEGDNWIIHTRQRKHHGLATPSMYTVFSQLEERRMLSEGDLAAAFMMKHFIMLIKQGESVTTGPLAGTTRNWLKPAQAKTLLQQFSVISKAMRAAVNHTTKIEFVFPPKELFDESKYINPEKRIFSWIGVSQSLTGGSKDTYGAGFLTIRRMTAKMTNARKKIRNLFMQFFKHETVASKIQTPPNFKVALNFDTNILTEPRQLLEEVKFLYDSAISDQRTAARELNRDPETLKASTLQSKKEQEGLQVWSAVGDQGKIKSNNPEGRPANPGTEVSEETRNQEPIARQTENTP